MLIYCISTYKRFTIRTQTRINVASQKFIMVVIYYLGGVNVNSDMKMGQSNYLEKLFLASKINGCTS